jgi:cell division protein FtsB
MVIVTTQALLSLWPFLKRAIFGEREIKEVLLENRHITFMLFCIMLMLATIFWVGTELDVVKAENQTIAQELKDLKATYETTDLDARRRRLDDLLK